MNNCNKLLAGLDLEHRNVLDGQKSHIEFKRGEYIYKEGIHPSGLFCLKKGKVMITKTDNFGNSIVLNLHREVTFLGVSDYLAQFAYQSNCMALEDVEVCFLKKDRIDLFIAKNKPFSGRLMKEVAEQYQQVTQRLLGIAKKNMNARLASALFELYEVYGLDHYGFIDVYLKRSELAMLSNMSVANAIRHLAGFQKLKLLSLKGKKIKINNLEELKKEAKKI